MALNIKMRKLSCAEEAEWHRINEEWHKLVDKILLGTATKADKKRNVAIEKRMDELSEKEQAPIQRYNEKQWQKDLTKIDQLIKKAQRE